MAGFGSLHIAAGERDLSGVQCHHRCFDRQGSGGGQYGAGTNPGQHFGQNQKTRWNHIWFRNTISSARRFLGSCVPAHRLAALLRCAPAKA